MTQSQPLTGKTYLVIEDEYLTATMLTIALDEAGARVLGPVSNSNEAFALLAKEDGAIDAAILDINLGGSKEFALADHLAAHGTPIVFTTGYDRSVIPDRFAWALHFNKPYDHDAVIDALAKL